MRGKHLALPPARQLSRSWIMPLALVLAMIMTSVAWADIIVNTVTTADKTVTIVAGQSAVVGFDISTNDPDDNVNGCNSGGSAEFTVGLPTGVTVATGPTHILTGCSSFSLSFSSATAGTYPITSFSVSGGRAGSTWNTSGAPFTLVVTEAPSNDLTPPTIEWSIVGTEGDNDWYTSNVSVSWTVEDLQSDVTSTTGCETTTITMDTAGQTVTCSATSAGGSNLASVTIKRDATAPTFLCDAADGLWHSDNVELACSAEDDMSGLTDSSPMAFNLETDVPSGEETSDAETDSQMLVDEAGNQSTAGPIGGNMIDRKGPSITVTTPGTGPYVLGSVHTADYSCFDGGSGVAAINGCVGMKTNGQPFDTASVGSKSFTVDAVDEVGNTSTKTANYSVVYAGGTCLGAPGRQVLQPVNVDGSSVFKKGSTVPIKFRVCDASGNSVGSPGVVTAFRRTAVSTGTVTATNEDIVSTTPDTAFRWSASDQQWIFNLSTKNLTASMWYTYEIVLNDGTTIEFKFGLK